MADKKGFFGKMIDNLDRKMKQKAKKKCSCCEKDEDEECSKK